MLFSQTSPVGLQPVSSNLPIDENSDDILSRSRIDALDRRGRFRKDDTMGNALFPFQHSSIAAPGIMWSAPCAVLTMRLQGVPETQLIRRQCREVNAFVVHAPVFDSVIGRLPIG